MESLLSCGICTQKFDTQSDLSPRRLECAHTFCEICISQLIELESNCPRCQIKINYNDVNKIALNETIIALLALNVEEEPKKPKEGNLAYEGICLKHDCKNQFACITCYELICGTCTYSDHKSCKTDYLKEALKVIKDEKSNIQLKTKDAIINKKDKDEKNLDIYKKELVVMKEKVKNLEDHIEKIEKNLDLSDSVTESLINLNELTTNTTELQLLLNAEKEFLNKLNKEELFSLNTDNKVWKFLPLNIPNQPTYVKSKDENTFYKILTIGNKLKLEKSYDQYLCSEDNMEIEEFLNHFKPVCSINPKSFFEKVRLAKIKMMFLFINQAFLFRIQHSYLMFLVIKNNCLPQWNMSCFSMFPMIKNSHFCLLQ